MDPIDGIGKLTRLLKKSVRDRSPGARVHTPAATGAPRREKTMAALERDLRTRLSRMRELDAGADARIDLLISGLLEWEFGERLRNEPQFSALVRRVRAMLDDDPALRVALHQLLAALTE